MTVTIIFISNRIQRCCRFRESTTIRKKGHYELFKLFEFVGFDGRNFEILKRIFVDVRFDAYDVIEFGTPAYLLLLYHCCQIFEFLCIWFPLILEICDFCFVLPSLLRFFLCSRPTLPCFLVIPYRNIFIRMSSLGDSMIHSKQSKP